MNKSKPVMNLRSKQEVFEQENLFSDQHFLPALEVQIRNLKDSS